jgi:hypothetical protein
MACFDSYLRSTWDGSTGSCLAESLREDRKLVARVAVTLTFRTRSIVRVPRLVRRQPWAQLNWPNAVGVLKNGSDGPRSLLSA